MPTASTDKQAKGRTMKEPEPVIPSPCTALYGVSIRSDGELDNIGIGIIETGNAEAVANRLEKLAAAIRNAAKRSF